MYWPRISLCILTVTLSIHTAAATALRINLIDSNNQPQNLSGAVIYAIPDKAQTNTRQPANIVQQQRQFDPYISVVQRGAQVSFPNNDSVSHHVYSFSAAKAFELPLYKKQQPAPLTFDKNGIVVLGCNIHDWMVAYLLVVDTPFFNRLEKDSGHLSLPPGKYSINLWHPRLHRSETLTTQTTIAGSAQTLSLQLQHPLRPPLDRSPPSESLFDDADDY